MTIKKIIFNEANKQVANALWVCLPKKTGVH
jgi:hypothetical protein